MGGIASKKEAKKQAALAKAEAATNAAEELYQGQHFRAEQASMFTKSGVTLEGSPLLVLEETERRSKANASRILAGGEAKARAINLEGRQALFGGIGNAAGTITQGYGALSGY